MVRFAAHLLLAGTIFMCPFVCRGGVAESTSHHQCCSCCHKSPSDDSSPAPNSGKGGCQCICGGAVMIAGVQIDLDHQASQFTTDFLIATSSSQLVATSAQEVAFATPSPPSAENPGRA